MEKLNVGLPAVIDDWSWSGSEVTAPRGFGIALGTFELELARLHRVCIVFESVMLGSWSRRRLSSST